MLKRSWTLPILLTMLTVGLLYLLPHPAAAQEPSGDSEQPPADEESLYHEAYYRLFSANTVDNIEQLYTRFGPNWVDELMPEWTQTRIFGRVPLWEWLVVGLLLVAGLGGGLLLKNPLKWLLRRVDRPWVKRLAGDMAGPMALLSNIFCPIPSKTGIAPAPIWSSRFTSTPTTGSRVRRRRHSHAGSTAGRAARLTGSTVSLASR